MSKTFFTLLFSFLLLFQTALYANEESDVPEEPTTEEVTEVEPVEDSPELQEAPVEEPQDAPEVEEAQEEISEAQKEADAAEAAELQETGVGEEPVAD